MQTNIQSTSSTKASIIEKLDELPDALMQTVSTILDGLISYHREARQSPERPLHVGEENEPQLEPFTTWAQFFEELEKLPTSPELANMTKQQRKEAMTEYLQEKYKNTVLDS